MENQSKQRVYSDSQLVGVVKISNHNPVFKPLYILSQKDCIWILSQRLKWKACARCYRHNSRHTCDRLLLPTGQTAYCRCWTRAVMLLLRSHEVLFSTCNIFHIQSPRGSCQISSYFYICSGANSWRALELGLFFNSAAIFSCLPGITLKSNLTMWH